MKGVLMNLHMRGVLTQHYNQRDHPPQVTIARECAVSLVTPDTLYLVLKVRDGSFFRN